MEPNIGFLDSQKNLCLLGKLIIMLVIAELVGGMVITYICLAFTL